MRIYDLLGGKEKLFGVLKSHGQRGFVLTSQAEVPNLCGPWKSCAHDVLGLLLHERVVVYYGICKNNGVFLTDVVILFFC